jgi:hypothetical protein
MVPVDTVVDGCIFRVAEDAAAEPVLGKVAEEALHFRIQATSTIETDGLRSGRNWGMAMIRDRLFGVLLDRFMGRKMNRASAGNPVTQLFMQSLGLVLLVWPLLLIAGQEERGTTVRSDAAIRTSGSTHGSALRTNTAISTLSNQVE